MCSSSGCYKNRESLDTAKHDDKRKWTKTCAVDAEELVNEVRKTQSKIVIKKTSFMVFLTDLKQIPVL